MTTAVSSHKDLIVWQKSVTLSIAIYKLTEGFPQREVYALSSQLRRCAVSIPSNISEGKARRSRKDFTHFLAIAYGSASEMETQLLIAATLGYCSQNEYEQVNSLLSEVSKMLRAMIEKLETRG
ncbi:four helix bundle protein [Candidatus Kaiserbacteria bacterium CG10_big_fil_rev_8_21_14_0_10_59_10]|uniref:Four helix bundle protein n=1 Tax=Candidatus Kaiserbacteria bacterium CG10_big_fil_rev_8_21_14_0_10_59_10 TaxID=1974612 RepID=A0A2H0UA13_9BACT|nr:MAG: four helix bundle protein [Candidatus Kaiserbacteria bacterium CG10_big_fil_rev_8_21_14_0_10_59_10]